jgi:enoyl-CoA hydratase
MSDAVTTSRQGDVLVADFDDGKANALTHDAIDALDAAIDEAAASARALVIVGREGRFSAGFDLSIMGGTDPVAVRDLLGAGARLGLHVFGCPVPVVLGVTGHALAMGGILTTCGDLRVGAAGSYKIGLNEVAIGMPVPRFGVELCRDRLDPGWFTRCVQHARICDPEEAVAAGFLDEVVPLEDVRDRSIQVAEELLSTISDAAFRGTRPNMRGALIDRIEADLTADLAAFVTSD